MKTKLTANKKIWTISPIHGTEWEENEEFQKIRETILKRDNYTCQCCGWRSKKYQEIHHINHNHEDNSEKNLITVCPLCHQVFHLPTASILKGGNIIWLPEISQEQLNNLCINLFMAMENPVLSEVALTVYTELEKRKEFVNNHIGRRLGGCEPGVFAEAIIEINGDKEIEKSIAKNFRLLPTRTRFKTQIDHWVAERKVKSKEDHYFKKFEEDKFKNIFKKIKNDLKQ